MTEIHTSNSQMVCNTPVWRARDHQKSIYTPPEENSSSRPWSFSERMPSVPLCQEHTHHARWSTAGLELSQESGWVPARLLSNSFSVKRASSLPSIVIEKTGGRRLVGNKDDEAVTSTHRKAFLTLHFQMSVERMLHTRTRGKQKWSVWNWSSNGFMVVPMFVYWIPKLLLGISTSA